jgi:hypothetical protein
MNTFPVPFARLLPAGSITRAVAAGAIAAGGLLAVPAAAQSRLDGTNPPPRVANILTTRITQGRAWRVDVGVATQADSNFQRLPPGEEVGALRVTPLIDAGIGVMAGRQQLFFGGKIGRDFFINKSDFNRSLWAAGGGVAWQLGARCSGVIGAEAGEQLLVQTSDQATFTPNVQTTKSVAGSANCQTAGGLGFGGVVRHDTASNDTPSRAVFDYRSTSFAPNISYGNNTLGQFSIGATISNVTFPQRSVATPSGFVDDGIATLNGRFGYSRALGTRLQVTAGVSYLKTQPDPEEVLALDATGQVVSVPREAFSGMGYDLNVGYQPSSRLTITVAADRNISTSQNVGALFTIAQSFTADVRYRIGPSLTAGLGGRRGTNTYKGSFASPTEPQARLNDRFEVIYASLDYSPVKLYSIGIDVSHQRRKSNPSTFDFNATTAALRLRVRLGRG